MSKLILMRGLAGSGKSTEAQKIMKADGNCVRINRDLIREMLHFNVWSGIHEKQTISAAKELALFFLKQKKNVIIDDCNLSEKVIQSWKDLAKGNAKVEIVEIPTAWELCVERDKGREKQVGRNVIVSMALQYKKFLQKPYEPFTIMDLDGTLCDIKHRLHFVKQEKKDWKSFFAGIPGDSVRKDVLDMIVAVPRTQLILLSGRPDTYRKITEEWLEKNGIHYLCLLMRNSGDNRDDTDVKKDIYERYLAGYEIAKVYDDRPRLVRQWQELVGVEKVVDVGEGIEF